jgi:hypothetical protein
MRVLAGEIINLEETRLGEDFRYSLSPIIEGDMIVGVSIFADNITNARLTIVPSQKPTKKSEELKLMALRSAMSSTLCF